MSGDPLVPALLLGSAVWYWLGSRRPGLGRRRSPRPSWRPFAFYAGLLSVLLALTGPVERLSGELLWAHMLQHILLMLVAAPLLVLGAPWLPFWRPLPLGFRRRVASSVVRRRWLAPVRALAGWATIPVVAWILFNGDLAVWHVPALYDLTVRNQGVHYVEHLSFLGLGMLFWAQVTDSPPLHCRLGEFERVLFLTAGAVASWLLGLGFVLVWAVRENDWVRLRPATISYTVLCIFQLIALLRYRSTLEAGGGTWLYIAFVISVGALGLFGVVAAGRLELTDNERQGPVEDRPAT